jgi:hypothetical protein
MDDKEFADTVNKVIIINIMEPMKRMYHIDKFVTAIFNDIKKGIRLTQERIDEVQIYIDELKLIKYKFGKGIEFCDIVMDKKIDKADNVFKDVTKLKKLSVKNRDEADRFINLLSPIVGLFGTINLITP